ncbi:helix-turn-helix transcriptional regulator [Streptomyces violaceochromogenes]|uniref:Helix-turn-helix transcriptional regulator n=1 Tax=Streptomyces violaceochromogenes TaxID=67377 RepID=A0ABU6LPG6_9ACTN|nr:helix-turn-helix transcriptional regulator [Streptomyces violaceochromogenes]MEC7051400.1 helix-turn-helix transcriptional regulator [Streptomyces violaceochromogenes]GHC94095.1 transcriptional regulator [Streptomyces violaceochromogenes]
MATDYQHAREALGMRLRELRMTAPGGRLTGTRLAEVLGWPQPKVSKLENGKQTATPEDLKAWAEATGHPEAYSELLARLRGFESHIRSWRRQLAAGHQPVQQTIAAEYERSAVVHGFESVTVPGILQTADYARHVFTRYAELQRSPRDTEEAVRSRLRRQELLYGRGRRFSILIGETALRSLICPPAVLAAQLDRLAGLVGLDTVALGVIPFTASLKIPPTGGFWVHDERLVMVENWHAELWIDDADSIALYLRTWSTLRESAVYGPDAQRLISSGRRALNV